VWKCNCHSLSSAPVCLHHLHYTSQDPFVSRSHSLISHLFLVLFHHLHLYATRFGWFLCVLSSILFSLSLSVDFVCYPVLPSLPACIFEINLHLRIHRDSSCSFYLHPNRDSNEMGRGIFIFCVGCILDLLLKKKMKKKLPRLKR